MTTTGLEAALGGQPSQREYISKVDGDVGAHLIALSCSAPPGGHARWSLRLLADRAVELALVEEISHETIGQTRQSMAAKPGQPEREDYEYQRLGVCNVFMACEPLAGWRLTKVTERRTKTDWAHFIEDIANSYPQAQRITLVMDNLNTHTPPLCTRRLHPTRPRHCGIALSSFTRPNTAASSTWPRLKSM